MSEEEIIRHIGDLKSKTIILEERISRLESAAVNLVRDNGMLVNKVEELSNRICSCKN
jgi:hypothetical protein